MSDPTPHTPARGENRRTTLWEQTAEVPALEPLAAEVTTDVLVIGAGMAGLSVAYELTRRGRRVLVVDDGPIAGGESARTTAHIATVVDDFYGEIERLHGEEGARQVADSYRRAVDRIEEIVREEGIDCDFHRVDGYWFAPAAHEEGSSALERELPAAQRAGVRDIAHVAQWPLDALPTFPRPRAILRVPGQGQFHPLRYLAGLASAIERHGGMLRGGAHAIGVKEPDDSAPVVVRFESGHVLRAREVVVATNTPFNDRVTMHTKQAPYRSYALAARIPRGTVPLGLYWDTLDPYHYVRLMASDAEARVGDAGEPGDDLMDDLLIVGGEDHKTGQEADENARFDALEAWTRERFPISEVVSRWSGQVLEPVDGVGFIGRNPGDRHTWIVTGDSGNGITQGAIAGMLLADLITGTPNAWESIYDPARVSLRAAPRWLEENLNVAAQYADLVTGGEVAAIGDVPRGEGRIIRDGARKLAVHRDADDRVTVRSAVCTHLGCIVDWNSAEQTWDCPCHGSRFAIDGRVINGPAQHALAAPPSSEAPTRETEEERR